MATPHPHQRPLILQTAVLAPLVLLHLLTRLDHWLLALLGAGLLLAVELLSLPIPPKGWARWTRQLGWLAAVLLVTGVSFQIYYWPHATTLQRLGMAALLGYSWWWALQRFPSTQARYYPALLLSLSFTGFLGFVYAYMHAEQSLHTWGLLALIGSGSSLLLGVLARRGANFPKEVWWRLPQLLHILVLMGAYWAALF